MEFYKTHFLLLIWIFGIFFYLIWSHLSKLALYADMFCLVAFEIAAIGYEQTNFICSFSICQFLCGLYCPPDVLPFIGTASTRWTGDETARKPGNVQSNSYGGATPEKIPSPHWAAHSLAPFLEGESSRQWRGRYYKFAPSLQRYRWEWGLSLSRSQVAVPEGILSERLTSVLGLKTAWKVCWLS